jgi:hypothetical protein
LIDTIDEQIKEHDTQLHAKLRKSVERRGQLKNIVVCETKDGRFECLDGSKMVKIFTEIGQTHITAFNLGILSDEEKNIVRIELSRDYFLTNYVYIGILLKETLKTHKIEDICNILPFDKRQVEHLVSMSDFDWEGFNQTKQVEGQKSIFDVDEEDEIVVETDTQETKSIMTNTDTMFEDFVFPTGLDKYSEEQEIANDGSDIDAILDSRPSAITEQLVEEQIEESPIIFEMTSEPTLTTDVVEEKQEVNESIETESGLKLNSGDVVREGDEVMLETRKGLCEILITKISDKWVVFKDLSEDGKRKDIQLDRFVEKASKKLEETISNIEENTEEKIEVLVAQKPQVEPQVDAKVEEEQTQSTIEVHPDVEAKFELGNDLQMDIEKDDNEDKPFYYDEDEKVIVIKKYADEIIDNLESLAKSHWKKSLKLFDEYFEGGEFKPSYTTNENTTIITHVIFISKYGVTMRVVLSQLIEMLNTINFEK